MPNTPLTDKERHAWKFAKEAHTGQIRKFISNSYFDAHVKNVNGIVKKYTTEEDLLCASILHDVVEDCYDDIEIGIYEISDLFGKRVGDLVSELTSLKDEIDDDYDGDKTTYLVDKLIHMSNDALIIKLADRLQNISDAFTSTDRFRKNYFEQTCIIIEELEKHRQFNRIHRLLIDEIKAKLKNIGNYFRIKRFKDFNESFDYLPEVIRNVEQMLYQIRNFEFDTKVDLVNQKDLIIYIKKESEDYKVFESGDIKDTLIEINQYLTLGEGLKLDEVQVTRIPISFESISFSKLITRNILLLDCNLVYKF